ncbi:Glucuronate isomerase [Acididesulfobacillus acetoxydans]|uniref:BH0493 protein n=1 Tax=Acididesulfobacillus acetoxydans TaxID=1561005 RepID=A0A8S0WQH3_9FIRM|nr:glucuronate isomerase [Acididesulfobacillus acetoxydans]CAA7602624.1 Glucuronate isomerase [Acididesulfobacillus acetoxydans]CEJ09179.1 BH0493 protein [Acididesulfobacillus acetoxydans]
MVSKREPNETNTWLERVKQVVFETPVLDMHTHLFPRRFVKLALSGVDELLTYHYLIAETLRILPLGYDEYWSLDRERQAELIWKTLFVERTPVSEAARGVITVLKRFGLPTEGKSLDDIRRGWPNPSDGDYAEKILDLAGVKQVVMTNDPFDPQEREIWLAAGPMESYFLAALRLDPLLNDYQSLSGKLNNWGYRAGSALTEETVAELRRFLNEWIERMKAVYVAVSLPETFSFPDSSVRSTLLTEVVLPVCRAKDLPLAMMIGVKRGVNPALREAGDSVGKADIRAVERLCAGFPHNKFMVTMLSRENQHELTVTGRKFRNLMVFGSWWFLNNPSLVGEITRMRLELLGTSFIPQHSDARILEQLIYKWIHSKQVIAKVLAEKYGDLSEAGWPVSEEDIRRDVEALFAGNFWRFKNLKL